MTKRQRAKYKIDRRLGENIWGRAKSPVVKRPYKPGQGGAARRRRGKMSDFAIQLNAKQKFKAFYGGISERQMETIVEKADRKRGDTGENIVQLLESRLQSVVYWSKLAPTLASARLLISHGHVLVNGSRVKSPGYVLKEGDVVSLKEKSKALGLVLESIQSAERDVPEYISFNASEISAQYVRKPVLSDVPYPTRMEPNLLIEYYSR